MKIAIYSDLHTEFEPFVPQVDGADVVVLAGDIGVKTHGLAWARAAFPTIPVIYVLGNHEFYGEATPHLTKKLKVLASGTNISVLDEDAVTIDGVRFLGATLWTDFKLFGLETRDEYSEIARNKMTDYKRIRVSPAFSRLTPVASSGLHRRARTWLTGQLEMPFAGPTVVVTHHAPSIDSIAPRHRSDPLSAAYASDLTHLLNGSAALWVHGHTHFAVDRVVACTRIVSNQRGYPDEPAEGFQPTCIVDV